MFPGDDTYAGQDSFSQDPAASGPGQEEVVAVEEGVRPCCVETITVHARFNPMMVCSECKHIIKCFKDEDAYSKYLIFCKSRKRQVSIGRVADYHTIIFKSYDAFR